MAFAGKRVASPTALRKLVLQSSPGRPCASRGSIRTGEGRPPPSASSPGLPSNGLRFAALAGAPVEVLQRVRLFADLDRREVEQIALLFKERRFPAGETIIREGSGGAASM